MIKQRKIVCYELNEVPWRVIDFYTQHYPHSTLANILNHSFQWETHTRDSGELHPWSTWPTIHRGVTNDQHQIRFLNQDLSQAASYPPLWHTLLQQGKKVGLFAPLQSYPVIKHPLMCFHLPDTFAPEATSYPTALSSFQAINLQATQANKGIQRPLTLLGQLKNLCLVFPQLHPKSIAKILHHLYQERRLPQMRSRRALLQPILGFDLFMRQLKQHQPDFATFFSNHVAGIMHRYWRDSFPEDFAQTPDTTDPFHRFSIIKAMHIFDRQLARLLAWTEKHHYDLVIASSMGQEAIDRGKAVYEIMIESPQMLLKSLKIDSYCQEKPAMYPDFVIQAHDIDQRETIIERLSHIILTTGNPLFTLKYPPTDCVINFSIAHTASANISCIIDDQTISIDQLGLQAVMRDQGTGYHQPYGSLIWHPFENKSYTSQTRATVDACQFAPTILQSLGVTPPDYMMPVLDSVID